MHELIFILLYVGDVVFLLFSYNLDDMQHLLDVLDTFCQISGLIIVTMDTTKMMAIKATQPAHIYIQGRNNTSEKLQISWY